MGGMTGGVHPCRRQASSDRDAVWCSEPTSKRQHRRPASRWGPRRLSGDYEAQLSITAPPPSGDPHSQIHGELHHQCRRRARSLPCESSQLKAQRRAAHRLPAGAASRAAWKAVSRACKQELRGCNIIFTEPAKWTGEPRERSTTAKHGKDGSTTFSTTYTGNAVCTSISATSSTKHRWSARKPVYKQRAPPLRGRTQARLQATHAALTRACKQRSWRPFSKQELELATTTWKRGNSTGPDGISLEAALGVPHPIYAGPLPLQGDPPAARPGWNHGAVAQNYRTPPRRGGTHVPSRSLRPSLNGSPNYYLSEADISCKTGTPTSGLGGDDKARNCW